MRKNGINRELRPIEGGLCAPEGYTANAVSCGLRGNGELDFAMLFSPRRCAVACVYASGKNVGAPVKISKRNMRNGYARAVLVNGGVANVFGAEGEKLALAICDLLFCYGVERTETVIASTGRIGERLSLTPFAGGIKELWRGLSSSAEQSAKFARAIDGEDGQGKELSFAFDLGDYPCKIGCVFKGGRHTSPNMATFLAFLTTDVNVTSPMLQKALTAEVKETLNQLNIDGISSPNDAVCIFANGKAGNYKIDCEDSEYKKLAYALRAVLAEICRRVASERGKPFVCSVKGARSKELARALSKKLVGTDGVKERVSAGEVDIDGVLSVLSSMEYPVETQGLRISLRTESGELVLFDEGDTLPIERERIRLAMQAREWELCLRLREGNYSATAYGQLR